MLLPRLAASCEVAAILLGRVFHPLNWSALRGSPVASCAPSKSATASGRCLWQQRATQTCAKTVCNAVGKRRQRLDEACQSLRPELSLNVIQSWISLGKVQVDGQVISKAGTPVPAAADIQILAELHKYVCRAGHKLEAALDHFRVDVAGVIALDAGLSTGGFTDCLLQRGAAHVYGVDVGYGQVAEKLRQDARLTVLDRTNLRYLKAEALGNPAPLDIATLDLSFISVLKVMPAVCALLRPDAQLVVLIKPQFEAHKSQVEVGGVITDPEVHGAVIESTIDKICRLGFSSSGWIESPIRGNAKGNTEFLAHFQRQAA